MNVPPLDRAPVYIDQGPPTTTKVASAVADYNTQLKAASSAFKLAHMDGTPSKPSCLKELTPTNFYEQ